MRVWVVMSKFDKDALAVCLSEIKAWEVLETFIDNQNDYNDYWIRLYEVME